MDIWRVTSCLLTHSHQRTTELSLLTVFLKADDGNIARHAVTVDERGRVVSGEVEHADVLVPSHGEHQAVGRDLKVVDLRGFTLSLIRYSRHSNPNLQCHSTSS